MKRLMIIALIALTMIGLFAASGTSLLAKSLPGTQLPAGAHLMPMTGHQTATANENMLTANRLYEAGQYAQAAQAYQQMVDQGVADSALFYNLGNAYFKQADYGRAILNYRRAQQLAPRDADIAANLTLARAQAVDQFEATEDEGLLGNLGGAVRSRFTHNEVALAALAAWILFVFLLILFGSAKKGTAWRKGLQYALITATVVLVVGIVALGSSLHVEQSRLEGVVVAAEVEVTSGPGTQYVTEFALHGGTEVDLVEVRGNWVRLALSGGELEGWVPSSAVEAVTG